MTLETLIKPINNHNNPGIERNNNSNSPNNPNNPNNSKLNKPNEPNNPSNPNKPNDPNMEPDKVACRLARFPASGLQRGLASAVS